MGDDPHARAKHCRQKAEEVMREAMRSTVARADFLRVAQSWETLAEHFEADARISLLRNRSQEPER